MAREGNVVNLVENFKTSIVMPTAQSFPAKTVPVMESDAVATSKRPIIRIDGVTKTYRNGTNALEKIDLDINAGEFVSLVGPSGCGKSTLLRLIAGLGTASAGEIDWPTSTYDAKGHPMPDLGFVFQEPTLMPWRTVFDNVYLPLKLGGVKRKDAHDRVTEALEMTGLARFAAAYPRQLSGGMKMRVSIARALVKRPKILLMDEPFAALDEITRTKLNNDLLHLWEQQGWTVVFVTHSIYESVYLSSRIVVMTGRPGRLSDDIEIDAAYPRNEAFRTSSDYGEYCTRVSAALHSASAAGDGEH